MNKLADIDWLIIIGFFVVSLVIGLLTVRRAGKSSKDFFLSGKSMPWWLLGVSMVATTFAADTPNFVTQVVRENGVAGNWNWWAFLLTGMLTVFVYTKFWKRSDVLTDLEFYELRYSGQEAAFLRAFRAVYLGFVFNIFAMAGVCLVAIKLGNVMLGLSPIQSLLIASTLTVVYSSLGGLRGIILTDLFQFILAMVGLIGAAVVIVNIPDVGGLDSLMSHPEVVKRIDFIPSIDNWDMFWGIFIMPLVIVWWNVWYPGAEPGGGGYIAQRMLAAKDEKHAFFATLFFNLAHYALRPWPWILIALASVIVFPDKQAIFDAFPGAFKRIDEVKNDHAFPAMLVKYLPAGLLGLVVASLIAAFMSTISTHLNWGASYLSNDFYKRFIKPEATEKEIVKVGRASTVILMILAGFMALALEDAMDGFELILSIGAGTGLIYILRWFWWRVNARSEIVAMLVSFVVAMLLKFGPFQEWFGVVDGDWGRWSLLITIVITTISWVAVAMTTPTTDIAQLRKFYLKVRPYGNWKTVKLSAVRHKMITPDQAREMVGIRKGLSWDILGMILGTVTIYCTLFGIGKWLMGDMTMVGVLGGIALICGVILVRLIQQRRLG